MSDFLRPEVRALLWRYRDGLIGLGMILLGIFWGLRGSSLVVWLGYGLIVLGALWLVAGLQRARFRQGGDGPGVVQIKEGAFAYFGPLSGGVMDIDAMQTLEIDPTSHPAPSWIITGASGDRLAIPINAAGAEDLFDVFTGLPDMKTDLLLGVLSNTPGGLTLIWHRGPRRLH